MMATKILTHSYIIMWCGYIEQNSEWFDKSLDLGAKEAVAQFWLKTTNNEIILKKEKNK